MKYSILFLLVIHTVFTFAQQAKDSINTYKKRVLENTEVDLLVSYYVQDGYNAAVTGGIGTEELTDIAGDINISIPLNADAIFTINATVSAYTSASSSNSNPFSGASSGGDDDDDRGVNDKREGSVITGTPWAASFGASFKDTWFSGVVGYSHTSDDRNKTYSANLSFANEYDYTSFGGGVGYTRLFNQKNTELGLSANMYLDTWSPIYPTEIDTYIENNGNLNTDFFRGVPILDHNGNAIDKDAVTAWKPINNTLIEDKGRNTYSFSLSFSQILSKKMQVSFFSDLVMQQGWLSNPMQRVYFADRENFYIGTASDIPNYTNSSNTGVFQLADDIERLPDTRLKFPIGMRLNYYINEFLVLKTYYRYYFDDWGINSHTMNIEMPIKIGDKFTIYPSYRFYNQTAADYFAPFDQNLSTQNYYTSDFDLSKFSSNQYGFGIKYTDIFTKNHIWKLGLKDVSLNYAYYKRDTGLNANIISFGAKFVFDK